MNLIVRNLLHVLRRFKLAAILNILGLSVAFAAFMIIMMQLKFDFGFDKFHEDYDKIYRLEAVWGEDKQAIINRPFAEAFFEFSPHILVGALANGWIPRESHFSVENNNEKHYFQERFLTVTPEFADVFTFDFVEGSKDALNTFNNVIIPQSLARKFFGNESAIGKHLIFERSNMTVGGVYRDFPENSILRNNIITPYQEGHGKGNWDNWSFQAYIRVNDAVNVPTIIENFKRNFDTTSITGIKLKQGTNLREAMAHIRTVFAEFDPNYPFEVRFFDEVLQQLYEKETKLSLLISLFSIIAIFISIVGVFGLVVFDSECRRKEIGIRKVLGASTTGIITMFNKTYIKMLLICFVIAAPLAWYTVSRWLENFAYRTPMYWWVYLLVFIAVAAITILTVTIQNWRVANDDPVKSIKTE
ncbi:MAG: ABC transporter permease [Dysgonamonadaceae bacterium]|jgi:ABC-type antimicrobial peptide transport system permease subunit|nr:ABC transporter permease [Dysgonamonadaceae bacterium]